MVNNFELSRQVQDLDRMRLLRELRLRGTMTEVAHALSYSRSAVSQQLNLLEREAGAQLLEREGRRVRLTAAGNMVADSAERILVELERLRSQVDATRSKPHRTLRVASMQSITLILLPAVLKELGQSHPELNILVQQAEPDTALSGLIAGQFDLVITESYPQWPVIYPSGVSAELMFTEPMRLAAKKGPEVGEPRDIGAFREARWALEPVGTPVRSWAENLCRRHGFIPRIAIETADLISQAHFAASGLAVALLPDLLWDLVQADVELIYLGDHVHREIHATTRLGSQSDRAINLVKEAVARSTSQPTILLGGPSVPEEGNEP